MWDIKKYREVKRNSKKKSFDMRNIKSFINKTWTLEYDIAMSKFKNYLYNSILLSKNEKMKTDKEIEMEFKNLSDVEVAKHIFVNNFYSNLDKNIKTKLSKPQVALNLGKLLKDDEKNKENIKTMLKEDEYLEYLVKAINYATGGSGE